MTAAVGRAVFVGLSALATGIAVDRATTRRDAALVTAGSVRAAISRDADSLDASLAALSATLRAATADSTGERRVRSSFRLARARYKRVEAVVEFYSPALAAAFNSRRQEVDDDDAPPPSTLAPSGFPALETFLWPSFAPAMADSARGVVDGMRPLVARLRSLVPALVPTDAQIIEIARLELARISTLGIAGFDAPRTGGAMRESAEAIDGVRGLLAADGPTRWRRFELERRLLDSTLGRAADYLRNDPDFETFNRLAFLVGYAEPAARALDALRRATGTIPVRIPRAWRFDAPSVYSPNAFDARAYAPSTAPPASPALIALGARLFVDSRLSGTATRSCASCHNPARAFADGLVKARSIDPGGSPVARNTPTLLNAALQPAQFADERSVTLEDQVLEVLRSPAEMSSSAELAAARLGRDGAYRSSFAGAFGDSANDAASAASAVTPLRIRQALAAYVRTLVSLESRFDKAVRGDTGVLTPRERRGFTLFMGRGGCGTCHFAPLFSGNTPPRYLGSDVEVIGTPASPHAPARLDPDSGRAGIDHLPLHLGAFKTPSLRNVTLTAPYMHNGAFRTLDDVLEFYDHGGARGAGSDIPNQTLSGDSLQLSVAERGAIVAFLEALVDTAVLRPDALRRVSVSPSGQTPHR